MMLDNFVTKSTEEEGNGKRKSKEKSKEKGDNK